MFKPFFVHRHTNRKFHKRDHRPRGFTLYVQPDPENYRNCVISGTWCSKDDNFCRSVGRNNALNAEQKVINKRDLPKIVDRMAQECALDYYERSSKQAAAAHVRENFEYLYKYLF